MIEVKCFKDLRLKFKKIQEDLRGWEEYKVGSHHSGYTIEAYSERNKYLKNKLVGISEYEIEDFIKKRIKELEKMKIEAND